MPNLKHVNCLIKALGPRDCQNITNLHRYLFFHSQFSTTFTLEGPRAGSIQPGRLTIYHQKKQYGAFWLFDDKNLLEIIIVELTLAGRLLLYIHQHEGYLFSVCINTNLHKRTMSCLPSKKCVRSMVMPGCCSVLYDFSLLVTSSFCNIINMDKYMPS